MRILQITLSINHLILAEIAERLVDAGHATHLLVVGQPGVLEQRLGKDQVTVMQAVTGGPAGRLDREGEVVEFSRCWAPDVVLYHDPWSGRLVHSLAAHARLVGFMHNLACPGGKLFRRGDTLCDHRMSARCLVDWYAGPCGTTPNPLTAIRAVRAHMSRLRLLSELEHVFVASLFMSRHLSLEGIDEQRITVVDVGYPTDTEVRPRRNMKSARPLVICVGRLTHEKGIHHVINGLSQPGMDRIDVVVIGDGYDRRRLEAMARRRSLGNLAFVGWLDGEELHSWYRRADLLLVPSVWPEPYGAVVGEAWRHGLRALISERGGLPEWLHHAPRTMTVDVTDHRRLSQAMLAAIGGTEPTPWPRAGLDRPRPAMRVVEALQRFCL